MRLTADERRRMFEAQQKAREEMRARLDAPISDIDEEAEAGDALPPD